MSTVATTPSLSPKVYVEQHGRRFRAVWRDADGKKQREPFATSEDAQLFRALCRLNPLPTVLSMVRDGVEPDDLVWPAPTPPPATPEPPPSSSQSDTGRQEGRPGDRVLFAPFAKEILDQATGVEDRTKSDNHKLLVNHVLPYFGAPDLTLRDIRQKERGERPGARTGPDGKPLSISNWLLWLGKRRGFNNAGAQTGEVLSPKTIRNLHALLSFVLQAAVDDDDWLLDRNPCAASRLPTTQREERVFLEHHEFAALLAAVPPYFRTLMVFLVATGVRWGEAAGLSVKHVHLDPLSGHPYIEVLVAWRRFKAGSFALGRVKSRCSQRIVTLPSSVVPLMRELLEGKGPEDAVFTMREGGRLHHSNFSRILVKAVAASGVPAATRCHTMRHTHVAWLISAVRDEHKTPMLAISRRVGHSSEAFTSKQYGHLLDTVSGRPLAALDLALAPALGTPFEPPAVRNAANSLFDCPLDGSIAAPHGPVLDAVDAALPEIELDDEDDLAA